MFSPCILLIDPDVKLLASLETLLSQAGYRVLTAQDSRHGAHLAQAALPELILCQPATRASKDPDIKRTLAQDARTASISFLFFTKPLDQEELVASVNEMIRSRETNGRRFRKPVTS